MKIRIEFNEMEKNVIANACGVTEITGKNDLEEVCEAKFGVFHYDPNGSIELDLKFGFISDIANITGSILTLLKAFVTKWSGESTTKTFKDGVEVVKVWNKDHTDFELVNKEEIEKANKEYEKEVKTTEATEEEVKEAE